MRRAGLLLVSTGSTTCPHLIEKGQCTVAVCNRFPNLAVVVIIGLDGLLVRLVGFCQVLFPPLHAAHKHPHEWLSVPSLEPPLQTLAFKRPSLIASREFACDKKEANGPEETADNLNG